jgi:hypothetical protein
MIICHFSTLSFLCINRGDLTIRRARLRNYYKAQSIYDFKNPLSNIEQTHQYIAVIDFEATCVQGSSTEFPNEIIEFPIVLVDTQRRTIVIERESIDFRFVFS